VVEGRTVWRYQADRLRVPHGLSARVTEARGGTGCSGANFRPPRSRTIRRCIADCLCVSHTGGTGGASSKSTCHPPFFPTHKGTSPPPSLLLFVNNGTPLWGFRLGHSPDRPSMSTDSLRGSPPCHLGISLINSLSLSLSLSLSDFEQEGG
jgi:hypothetical protein